MTRGAATRRALVLGSLIGAVAAASNFHVSLRTGWSLPVMTTAAIVAFAVAGASRGRAAPMTAPEAVGVAAVASAAGYMSGGGNAAAFPALVMLGQTQPHVAWMALWFAVVGWLGVALAWALRARFVGREELPFPTASATATIAQSLDARDARRSTRALAASGALAAVTSLGRHLAKAPPFLGAPGTLGGSPLASLTFGVDLGVLLVGAGALMTARAAVSGLIGGLATYALIAPRLIAIGEVREASYRAIVSAMVWPAAALLVAAAVTTLAIDVTRSLRREPAREAPRARGASGAAAVVLLLVASSAALWAMGARPVALVLIVPVGLVVTLVAVRSMGETDIVPTKALAPIAQLAFGALTGDVATASLAPNLTSAVALQAADTVGSLEAARSTGADPRRVAWARALGVGVGACVIAVMYAALLPDPARQLPSTELPAPGVLVWRSVAEAAARGVDGLTPWARRAALVGAGLGASLAALERALPPRWARWVPSPAGVGSGMVLPLSSSLSIAAGALGRALWAWSARRAGRPSTDALPIASGLVAGESLEGIVWQLGSVVAAALAR